MKRLIAAACAVLILACAAVSAQKKKHTPVPAVFEHAQFVYVERAPGIASAEDEQAVRDVQDALQDWNRYKLAMSRRQADFVLVVRKGRAADVRGNLGTGVSLGSRMPPNQGADRTAGNAGPTGGWGDAGVSAEAGPREDTLQVYLVNSDGKLAGPLWTLQREDGLNAPPLMLMQQLRRQVEQVYPAQPPPAQAPPAHPAPVENQPSTQQP